ncbi:MAG: 5-formyltetrahydrofolate cyclo-ligase [Bacillota bacterium]
MATYPSEGDSRDCSCPSGEKRRIRRVLRSRRDALDSAERKALNRGVSLLLLSTPEYVRAHHIMFFASFGGEICTWGMMDRALDDGKKVYLPRTDPDRRRLTPVRVRRSGGVIANLAPGPYGIKEPAGQAADPGSLDLVCVPALAFDREGFRVGYGGGYYDRFLRRLSPSARTVGLGYHLQVLPRVPRGEHDQPVDAIVTEREVIHCRG